MNHELELKLYEKYPKILKDCGGDMRVTCMAFWLETGDGWYKLLDETMGKIQYLCDLFTKDNGAEVQLVADQLKEKLSTLRFYEHTIGATDLQDSILRDIISKAESRSARICELCGEHGETCSKWGWLSTLCYSCARKDGEYTACDEGVEEYWKTKDAKSQEQTDTKAE